MNHKLIRIHKIHSGLDLVTFKWSFVSRSPKIVKIMSFITLRFITFSFNFNSKSFKRKLVELEKKISNDISSSSIGGDLTFQIIN
jgi:hypothetical protein